MDPKVRERRVSALGHRLASVATDAGRTRAQASRERLRVGAWPVLQCSLAAGLAWLVASHLLDHPRPFFATVAAVVCLSGRTAQRLRRVAELAVGVTVGVGVGEALVQQIGTGAWQIGLVVGVALLLATALDGGALLIAQTGLQAVFVVGVPHQPGGELARWQDAMVGGAIALLVAALLPGNPWRQADRAAATAGGGLVLALREGASALREHDAQHAGEALMLARDTTAALEAWSDALAVGHEIARLSPLRRDPMGRRWQSGVDHHLAIDRASRNCRVVLRRVLSAIEVGEALPPELPGLLDGLAELVDRRDDPGFVDAITSYGSRLDLRALSTSVSATVAIAQLRAVVVDLFEGEGWDRFDARDALPPIL